MILKVKGPFKASKPGRREVFCRFYGDCLKAAFKREWRSWSCGECSEYDAQDHSLQYWKEEVRCCVMLFVELFGIGEIKDAEFTKNFLT